MATSIADTPATPPEPIRSPLERLRGTIRRYVVRDGLLALGLLAAASFWLGLAFDYGSFKLFAFDWVRELPHGFRGALLAGLTATATIIGYRFIARRLLVEFRPPALALILEKKFPELLGDRLITAVEMADIDRAERRGYSRALVEDTIREAEERVARVPVDEVFDWARLKRMARWLVALAVGPLVVFGAAYSAVRRTNPLTDYLPRLGEVATIWVQRNLLLRDVIWPRKAYLDVLDFPASGELRIGRDAASPRLRFKARRWVIADPAAADGWRPMVWSDLRPGLLGGPAPDLPTGWLEPGVAGARSEAARAVAMLAGPAALTESTAPASRPPAEWTLDEVEIALEDETIRKRLEAGRPDDLAAIRQVFDTLAQRAGDSAVRAVYRRLDVPERIEVKYWGAQTSSRLELLRGPGWEYAGTLGDLKESVKFRARGSDFYTTVRGIVLVPPPMIQQLKRSDRRPAYLYHRPPLGAPPEGGPAALRGLRQLVEDVVSLNGATSRVSVPAGTDLTLVGLIDKELAGVKVRTRSKEADGSAVPDVAASILDDRASFRHTFPAVARPIDFDFEFTDTDGVKSSRHVVVDVIPDQPPMVNVAIDGLRKSNQGHYLATPVALIPFDGKVIDGRPGDLGGLERIEYQVGLTRLEAPSAIATRAEWLTGALLPAVGGRFEGLLVAALAGAETTQVVLAVAPAQTERAFAMETFQQALRERAARDVPRAELLRRLDEPPGASPLIKEWIVQPKFEGLDLRDRLPDLKVRGELEVQPRYRMKLTVVATDTNIETGPGIGTNKEPPFTVMIVSETELLVEVARDEEAQHVKAEDAVARLREVRGKLDTVAGELPAVEAAQLPTFAQRAAEMTEATVKARDIVQEVFSEYSRILRELELNRVTAKFVEKVKGEICLPLESALRGEFVAAEEALEKYHKELDAGRKPDPAAARAALDRLIAKLERVMAAMGEMTTLNKLITTLQEIEKAQEQAIGAKLRELQRLQREKLIRDLDKLKGIE